MDDLRGTKGKRSSWLIDSNLSPAIVTPVIFALLAFTIRCAHLVLARFARCGGFPPSSRGRWREGLCCPGPGCSPALPVFCRKAPPIGLVAILTHRTRPVSAVSVRKLGLARLVTTDPAPALTVTLMRVVYHAGLGPTGVVLSHPLILIYLQSSQNVSYVFHVR
jgi:hypothetical protein